jgi:tRNA(adenine34) deaminase
LLKYRLYIVQLFILCFAGCSLCSLCTKEQSSSVYAEASNEDIIEQDKKHFYKALDETHCFFKNLNDLDAIISDLSQCIFHHEHTITEEFLQKYPHEKFIIITVKEALTAVASKPRNYGVGSVLVKRGNIVASGSNSQLKFNRTDLHGEMYLMNIYEDQIKPKSEGLQYTKDVELFTSSEPCPMCFTRIAIAGLTSYYASSKRGNGGVSERYYLPHAWADAAKKVTAEKAKCSRFISTVAEAVHLSYVLF